MGKFCNQCGRPLQEGEICTCQQGRNPMGAAQGNQMVNPQRVQQSQGMGHQAAPGMGRTGAGYHQGTAGQQYNGNGQRNNQQGAYGQQGNYGQQPYGNAQGQGGAYGGGYSQQPYGQQPIGGYGQPYGGYQNTSSRVVTDTKNLFREILPVLKDPVRETGRIAQFGSSIMGIEMVVVNLVVTLIMLIFVELYWDNKYQRIGRLSEYIPYGKIFFYIILALAIGYFAMAGLLLLTSKVFFGAYTDFATMISIVGVKALLDALVTIVGIFFLLAVPLLGGIIVCTGQLYSTFMCIFAYAELIDLSGSCKAYSLLITTAILIVLFVVYYFSALSNFIVGLGNYL